MKINITTIQFLLFIIIAPHLLSAQENRTIKTTVADILALLPAEDHQQAGKLFQDIMSLGDEGLTMITDGVKPNGNAEGVPSRYGVSLLTHYARSGAEKQKVEQAYLRALAKSNEPEVKAYFISNLELTGSNNSISTLAALINDTELYNHVIGTLVTIGTPEAKDALQGAVENNSQPAIKIRLVKALGDLKHRPALQTITKFTQEGNNVELTRQSLWAISQIADASSAEVLIAQAKKVNFKSDPTEATNALIEYMNQMSAKGDASTASRISSAILQNTAAAAQQHYRLAALKISVKNSPAEIMNILTPELNKFNAAYRKEILNIAVPYSGNAATLKQWGSVYKKSQGEQQAEILSMMARSNHDESFVASTLVPALSSKNMAVRKEAAQQIANSKNKKFTGALIDYLIRANDDGEVALGKSALHQLLDKDNISLVAQKIPGARSKNKIALLEILSQKRATGHFDSIVKETESTDPLIRAAAYEALVNVSAAKNIATLLDMLLHASSDKEITQLQNAIISCIDKSSEPLISAAYQKGKEKILPLLAFTSEESALKNVSTAFYSGSEKEREIAFQTLANWQNQEAIRTLLDIRRNNDLKKYHEPATQAVISQVSASVWPDDQKLLMLREVMSVASSDKEKKAVIQATGRIRTFLSLVFVSKYIDDPDLGSVAARAAMQIALPTADAKPGLAGVAVRDILQKVLDKLTGDDSQYEVIDVATYLSQMPYTRGFESIFNGHDLSGWQGLVENPIARSKMTKEELKQKQLEANRKVSENWQVKDGMIVFSGDGANLVTVKPYGDFEMLVDWKISKNGDSGIYLRGSPQVQIWDTSRVDVGAQVGSGGLYNNKTNRSAPLAVADNPVGEWNTFRIRMIGDKVTVHLNGVLVVDSVVLENYWDRSIPIFPEGSIELQAHGTDLAFRNIYVRELTNKAYEVSAEEKDQGFEVLFNGKDLDKWTGNKKEYVIEDNTIAIYPAKGGHGNLYTEKEYSDFILRFEFQLTPGANNGLGIHAPLEGDVAYVGKEIQILDNTAPVYAKLEPWQYHGSVYGVIAAKRDFLRPVGEWNVEEVYVKGNYIKVTLNGTVIVEGDMKQASSKGTLDHKDHPGLKRNSGHIGFLGHGSIVKFRNLRIKDLSKK
jgi:hypothetical protein